MNQETIISVMKFMRDTCKASESCRDCVFRIYNDNSKKDLIECGLAVIPSAWNINEPRTWKAFKE